MAKSARHGVSAHGLVGSPHPPASPPCGTAAAQLLTGTDATAGARDGVTAHDEHGAGAARAARVPTGMDTVPQDGHATGDAKVAGVVAIGAGVASFQ